MTHIKTNEEILENFHLKGKITEQHAKDILAILSIQREADERALVEEIIGNIGANLLAKHFSQAVLDAYFDASNEEIKEYGKNN